LQKSQQKSLAPIRNPAFAGISCILLALAQSFDFWDQVTSALPRGARHVARHRSLMTVGPSGRVSGAAIQLEPLRLGMVPEPHLGGLAEVG